ncbi:hypothetical protein A9Q99_10135 [Gammaproteobacteria bacterium 45_16_T64]|nr:hypothetical protein A9Q99_10135 [Gammaproteobacteria bacterium 45_16_T64]
MSVTEIAQGIDRHSEDRITTDNGAWASLSKENGEERLQVFSSNNELVFEFDPNKGVTRVIIPTGDLELVTEQGGIKLDSAKDVSISGEHVDVSANAALSLKVLNTAKDLLRPVGTSLSLLPEALKLGSQRVDVAAQQARIDAQDMRYRGDRVDAVFEQGVVVAEKIETLAKTLIQKSENLYSTVKNLSQLRSGRVRQLVESSFYVKSQSALHKTDDDFKVRAEKIHLG